MRVEKKVLNDALRVLGKVVCQTSPVELYSRSSSLRSLSTPVGDAILLMEISFLGGLMHGYRRNCKTA